MEPVAARASVSPPVVFRDGLGDRRRVSDPGGHDNIDVLCLRSELTAVPSFEFALRERVGRLAGFRHAYYGRVRTVERLGDAAATLALVSDATPGVRLSEILDVAERKRLPLDINAALCLIRQLVPAVAVLHEHAHDVAHGAIAPERIILLPNARLVIVEHVLGAALEQLRFSHERYWKELRIALPRSAGLPRFDHRADVAQLGVVALSLIVGRPLRDDEYPGRIAETLASAWAVSSRGGVEPLPAGLRAWLASALQIDLRRSFSSAVEARAELERVLAESDFVAAPAALEAFLAQYHAAVEGAAEPRTAHPAPPPPVVINEAKPAASPAPPPVEPMAASVQPVRQEPAHVAPAPTAPPTFATPPIAPIAPAAPVAAAPAGSLAASLEPMATPVAPIAASIAPPAAAPSPIASSAAAAKSHPAHDFHVDRPSVPERPVISFGGSYGVAVEDADEESRAPAKKTGGGRTAIAAAVLLMLVAGGGVFAAKKFGLPGMARTTTGTLVVNTNPAGAQVTVDGTVRGVTPVTLTLAPGSHAVELRAGGEPRTIPVTITAGSQVTQYVELPRAAAATGHLDIKTEPAGAHVSVDGTPEGISPLTIRDLTPGEHTVEVTSDLGTMKQTVIIEAGMTASLVMPLGLPQGAPVSGWISVTAPVEMQLYENGRLLGSSQTDRIMVAAGAHQIDLVNEVIGYKASRSVQVAAGKVSAIAVKLPNGTIALNAIPWAEVWIDGVKIGETPIGNYSLPIGPHDIVFKNPDLGEQRQAATVTLSGTTRLSVDMRKK